jgi:hypothetical protein
MLQMTNACFISGIHALVNRFHILFFNSSLTNPLMFIFQNHPDFTFLGLPAFLVLKYWLFDI